MSLSGSLGFVPVDEVLRLLTRAGQQGSVDVSGVGFYGRIYVGGSGIDLATTHDDDVLHTQFINSRLVDEDALRRVAMGETTLAATAGDSDEVQELIREITIEALYQISQHGSDFNVRAEAVTDYASPKSFDLESLLHDVRTRTKDWEKVSEVIDDLERPLILNRDIGEREEVKMQVNDWKVLSEIGSGASVAAIAERLGTTRFWTARVAARLVGNELVQVTDDHVETPQVDVYETPVDDAFAPFGRVEEPAHEEEAPTLAAWDTPTVYEAEATAVEDLSDAGIPSNEVSFDTEAPQEHDDARMELEGEDSSEPAAEAVTDWWGSQVADQDTVDQGEEATGEAEYQDADSDVAEVEDADADISDAEDVPGVAELEEDSTDAESLEVDPNQSWWTEPKDEEEPTTSEDNERDEEDTEAFLEKVFSELESSDDEEVEEEEPQAQEGHGLLRRRRMGALRDLSSDS